jgi:hypothetical protein
MVKNNCIICGREGVFSRKITDPNYVFDTAEGRPICPQCFEKWASGDVEHLLGKIREKFKR